MVFRIVSSTIDIDLTREQALNLYRQLRVALFTRPIQPIRKAVTS